VILPILFQDDAIVAIDKPGGMLVHRSREAPDRRVVLQTLRDQIGRHLYPVHRLDRAASGVLVFALSSEAAAGLQASLGDASAEKQYVTFVRGEIEEVGEIDRPLTSDAGVKQEAITRWWRLEVVRGFSLVRVRITTGRRHQIRRHMSRLAHQIVGDSSYGKGRINRWLRADYGLPRLFLHAERLAIVHPSTGLPLEVRAPLAADLAEFLDRFRAGDQE
jgi:tRNA pseudouridine65 synthase